MSTHQGTLLTKDYKHFSIINAAGEIFQFQGAQKARGCLPGDQVSWNTEKECAELISVAGTAAGSRGHGTIVGILELTSKTRYGLTSRGHPIFLFRPFDAAYPSFVVASSQKNLEKNMLCSILYKDVWKPGTTTFPRGEVAEYFGRVGDWQAERAALLARWCPGKPAAVDRSAWENRQPSQADLSGRFEITDAIGYTFHIDPKGCRDVDDIITICHKLYDCDYFTAIITIADVGAWIESTSQIAQAAAELGQSFYDEKGKVLRPMLRDVLSEGVLSLTRTPAESWKLGISLRVNIRKTPDDNPYVVMGSPGLGPTMMLSKIKSSHIHTYIYDDFTEYRVPRKEIIENSKEIYKAIETLLNRPGADWNTHKFVETCMLLYNEWVGGELGRAGLSAKTIYRSQEPPSAERMGQWTEIGRRNGLGDELAWLGAKAAKYSLGTGRHTGLKLATYTHSSSPIRRFADLWNQWLLHAYLEKKGVDIDMGGYPIEDLVRRLNERMKAAKRFSRELAVVAALETGRREFSGICLEWRETGDGGGDGVGGSSSVWKGRFWIPEWKEITIVRQMADKARPEPGTHCRILCGVNWGCGVWSERFVLEIAVADCAAAGTRIY